MTKWKICKELKIKWIKNYNIASFYDVWLHSTALKIKISNQ